jgi:hypothetical protein
MQSCKENVISTVATRREKSYPYERAGKLRLHRVSEISPYGRNDEKTDFAILVGTPAGVMQSVPVIFSAVHLNLRRSSFTMEKEQPVISVYRSSYNKGK